MSESSRSASGKKTAGAFDVRTIIGALLSIYGVILLLMGIFGDTAEERTGGVNANLWAGLALLVVGVGFLVWVRVRPIVVPVTDDQGEPKEAPGH
jgi:hypothetical protein